MRGFECRARQSFRWMTGAACCNRSSLLRWGGNRKDGWLATGYHLDMKKAASSKRATSKPGPRYPPVPAKAVSVLRDVERALASNDLPSAERALALAMVLASDHPQTLRLLGRAQYQRGDWAQAASNFAAAHARRYR